MDRPAAEAVFRAWTGDGVDVLNGVTLTSGQSALLRLALEHYFVPLWTPRFIESVSGDIDAVCQALAAAKKPVAADCHASLPAPAADVGTAPRRP